MSPRLKNPKHELMCVEVAGGVDPEFAYLISGAPFHLGRQEGESGGQRRSRVVRQIVRRLDTRIAALETLHSPGPGNDPPGFALRNRRAIAELCWARAIIANGGTEPEEWREEEQEEPAPSVP